jgi:F-type H+-transporting ATPase subunit a
LNTRKIRSLLLLIFAISFSFIYASEPDNNKPEPKEKEFNAGTMIIEHVTDAYYWHIISFGSTEVSIPLPIILLDEGKLVTFCSSEFEHGEKAYNGFKLETEGANKGKIVSLKNGKAPLDFSITKNVLSLFINIFIISFIFILIARTYKRNRNKAPKGLQSLIEPLILFIRDDIARPIIGEKRYEKFLPYLLTIFFFIFFNNLIGLIPIFPGGVNLTGNLAITGVLALYTFFITNFIANRAYWVHIFNTPGVPWWLKIPIPLMPVVELLSVFTKPFVLMVRLFANISAGHIISLGFISLIFIFGKMHAAIGYGVSPVSVAFVIFMNLLDLLVAFLQAYVFTILSSLYFGLATEEHH